MDALPSFLLQITSCPNACVMPSPPFGPWISFSLTYSRTWLQWSPLSWITDVSLSTRAFLSAYKYAVILLILKQNTKSRNTLCRAHVFPWLLPNFSAPCSKIPQKSCLHVLHSHLVLSQVALSAPATLAFCWSLELASLFLPPGLCRCSSVCLHSSFHTPLHGLLPHFIEVSI